MSTVDEQPPERTTMYVGTIRWDADSQWSEVCEITDLLEAEGYETRMMPDNSRTMVYRDESDNSGKVDR